MKKYRNSLKRAAALALSTILAVSGAAVSADEFTSFEEDAVFAEDSYLGNEEAGFTSTDDGVFEETYSSSEDAAFIFEDADYVSEDTIDKSVVTEEAFNEGSQDVFSAENTVDEVKHQLPVIMGAVPESAPGALMNTIPITFPTAIAQEQSS